MILIVKIVTRKTIMTIIWKPGLKHLSRRIQSRLIAIDSMFDEFTDENEVEFPDRDLTGFFASQRSRNESEKPSVVITGESIIKNLDPRARRMSR